MIKTGLESAAYFCLYDYEQGLKRLKKDGYDCIDYSELCNKNSDLYKMSDNEYRDFLNKVGAAAKETGVEIVQLHALWPMEDRSEEGRKATIAYFIKEIEGAHCLGCKHVVIHPFMPYGWGAEVDREEIWNMNVSLFQTLLPYAEKYDVILCVENLPFTALTISTVAEVKRLVRTLDSPYVKVCLDTGHANVFHDDLAADVRLLGDDLATLHVHDNKGNWDQHLPPYQGNIDWEAFLLALKEIGFKGCFSLETYPSLKTPQPILDEMRVSLSRLAKMMADKLE